MGFLLEEARAEFLGRKIIASLRIHMFRGTVAAKLAIDSRVIGDADLPAAARGMPSSTPILKGIIETADAVHAVEVFCVGTWLKTRVAINVDGVELARSK